ncbi:hypothetical protein CXG81DRAFT_24000 [Caulochytrium protostelioides]|uniref:Uncharacterized protein n=1 Tax=Caulochytrium protostelioides TaxID=1555241 RepID=A0A4P9XCZ6_9FUNG|nr:hypothetical protein CXG81DRAFT_24000 [Caulochytrium protostelioides]|eukprot:RKP03344.1 hypothetical protein CXG81DRAFT_24000 [Caulochytrium protostelioides]
MPAIRIDVRQPPPAWMPVPADPYIRDSASAAAPKAAGIAFGCTISVIILLALIGTIVVIMGRREQAAIARHERLMRLRHEFGFGGPNASHDRAARGGGAPAGEPLLHVESHVAHVHAGGYSDRADGVTKPIHGHSFSHGRPRAFSDHGLGHSGLYDPRPLLAHNDVAARPAEMQYAPYGFGASGMSSGRGGVHGVHPLAMTPLATDLRPLGASGAGNTPLMAKSFAPPEPLEATDRITDLRQSPPTSTSPLGSASRRRSSFDAGNLL